MAKASKSVGFQELSITDSLKVQWEKWGWEREDYALFQPLAGQEQLASQVQLSHFEGTIAFPGLDDC